METNTPVHPAPDRWPPNRARRRVRRRAMLTVVATALAAACVYPAVTAAHAQTTNLNVLYKTSTGPTGDEAEPWFEVVNNTSSAIPYDQITIDYYFAQPSSPYVFQCAWAAVGCGNLTGTIVPMPTPAAGADHYLQVTFSAAAGSLAAGANSGDMELRMHRTDWQNVSQGGDYSYNAADTSYTANPDIAAYVNGALAWGTPPAGAGSPSPSPTPTTTSPPPTGTMFDDFDYTSSSDPNLAAHGWSVRTSSGGPGVTGAAWSAGAITFPADSGNPGGHVMQLSASTDGTAANTVQSELDTTSRKFFQGTYAARVYFTDAPATGPNGDDINETFYTISPLNECDDPNYSENDYEYLPNGGWGIAGPRMYTTTWYTYCNSPYSQDNSSTSVVKSWAGWHTVVETVLNGTVTYYIDGNEYWSTTGKYYPREDMTIDFNMWFINGYLTSSTTPRTWDDQVAWVYYANGQALTTAQVNSNVSALTSAGTNFEDTVPAS
jgi:Cellulose binding domain